MVFVAQAPHWFVPAAVTAELLSAVVLALVAMRVLKYYWPTRNADWLRLGAGFGLLSVAFLARALLSIGLAAKGYGAIVGGVVALGVSPEVPRSLLFGLNVFSMQFVFLLALLLLFGTYHEISKTIHGLIAFLLALVLFFAQESYLVFELLALVFLLLLSTALMARYTLKGHWATRTLAWCFGVLAAARFAFLLLPLSSTLFVLAELVQLAGFALLLWTYIILRKHAKKIPD